MPELMPWFAVSSAITRGGINLNSTESKADLKEFNHLVMYTLWVHALVCIN